MKQSTIMCLLIVAVTCGAIAAEPEKQPAIGLKAITDFANLPLLVDWPAYQDSSYSREHQNSDAGNYLYTEVNGKRVEKLDRKELKKGDEVEYVMVDTDGPGAITRIWSTNVTGRVPILHPGVHVRFYFDGEKTPSLDLSAAELFGQKDAKWPFVQPLSRTFESGNNDLEGPASLCYVPIPFAKHVKITTNGLYFYHFNYLKYPAGTPIESFSMALAEKNRATLDKAAQMFLARGQMPSPPTEPMSLTEVPVDIKPGKTAVLYEGAGPAVVRALKIKLQRATNLNLRGLVLQIQYEGSQNNSVNVPIGDFYGTPTTDMRYRSLPMGTTDAGYYCYFPMPFRKSIRIQVRNDTTAPARLFASIAVQKVQSLPGNAGYFHAAYHQDKDPANGVDYTLLNVKGGRGKFVGCSMFMQGGTGTESISFLEGDEAIYVDDETTWPSRWVGTGTEDYFNGSYYWNGIKPEDMDQPYGGLVIRAGNQRRIVCYRWHVTDFISFTKRIKVDIQHGPVSNFRSDYASAAYWYMDKPVAAPKLPSMADRIPRTDMVAPIMMGCRWDGEFTSDGEPVQVRWLRKVDPEFWTDVFPEGLAPKKMQIFCSVKKIGQKVTGKVFVPGPDWYDMTIYLTTGPSYGKFAVLLDGRLMGNLNCYSETFNPAKDFKLPRLLLKGGNHELTFLACGQSEMATGLDLGVVAMQCTPIGAKVVDSWQVIGPWPCPEKGGWETVNPPEVKQDLSAEYPLKIWRAGHGGRFVDMKLKWRALDLPPGSGVPSAGLFGWESWHCGYGLTFIWSPREQTMGAFFGKDDGLAVWVNDKKVLDDNTWSHYLADHLIAACPLKKGWNKVLVKNANWHGNWAWSMKLTDPKKELKVTNIPPPEFGGKETKDEKPGN